MKHLHLFAALLALLLPAWAQAQVVTTTPVFFTENSTGVTITYNAALGNGALNNFAGEVYIWTGTVTNLSTSNTTWRNVKSTSTSFNTADPTALMTRSTTNPNIYTITFNSTVRNFYPVPSNETVLRLGMIFKNAAGTVVGRAANGGDIFVDVNQAAQAVRITQPGNTGVPQFVTAGTPVAITGTSALAANLTITLNGTTVTTAANATSISGNVTPVAGYNLVKVTAGSGATAVSDSLALVVRPAVTTAALPAGAKEGITYLAGGTSVILALTAPNKQFVYALGEFNNFQPLNTAYMNKTPDGNMWWVQLNGLTAGREYAYQYFVDGTLHVADPYTEKILDPGNDQYIPAVTYPGRLSYPAGQTGIMSTFQTNQTPYTWQTTTFTRPAKNNLVVYELHLRDFIARHDFQTLRDSLNYLQKLGVNCIELMPVNEFEGNDSWGYNPSFYFAVDKYYGTKDALKALVDECHRRGMAVVLDMVLNHSCGQSPMVQLYFDNGNPAANSPWFNRTATHPYNVCYDFNHESTFTKAFSKKVMDFWVNEFRIDGYRFDLSKGFTQRNNPNDVGAWGAFDQSRINIWNDYNNHIQANRAGTYVILEHFADNTEETVLSNAGMMLWGNMAGAYSQAGQGRTSNLSYGYYGNRGWQQPNLVSYMESHDEERNMYDALNFGQSSGSYNIRDRNTALARMEMNAAFFFTIPGPKMLWQFGELGYDISINQNGRTGPKPILWNYYQDHYRRKLHATYANLIALHKLPAFTSGTFTYQLGSQSKVVHLSDASLNMTAVGNFGVQADQINPNFQHTGKWYNYLTGDSITVANVSTFLNLSAGEYAVYIDRRVARTVLGTRAAQATNAFRLVAAPNPASTSATLYYELPQAATVQVSVSNVLGQSILSLPATREGLGQHTLELPLDKLAAGVYMVRLQSGNLQQTTRLVVSK